MTLVTRREEALEYTELFRTCHAGMAIFCTASHWNTEAILLAGQMLAEKHGLSEVPLAVAMTFTYPYMPQAVRITHSGNAPAGFLSNMAHLRILCDGPDAPYPNVVALPHLDHADPGRDRWALTEGLPHLATVMFDGQKYPFADNLAWTKEYVATYGDQVMVEGIIEELAIEGKVHAVQQDDYVAKAVRFVRETGVDLLVADLGTEQNSVHVGEATYLKARAQALTASLDGVAKLVLHGTSCLSTGQMLNLADDGIVRVNMWTRVVREAGQYAAAQLIARQAAIAEGGLEATESHQYIEDSTVRAAEVMLEVMEAIGYARLAL